MDKLVLKLQRAYQRRDHYAQLYYKTLSELEEMKWQLNIANKKIQELSSSQSNISSIILLYNTYSNTQHVISL
jgi:cytochrome c-type biogenesis protein CcmH/NrfG